MNQPTASSNRPYTPTIDPLRINKSPAGSPAHQQSAASNTQRQPPYPTGYSQPSSPPPNRPLPYPDDRRRPSAGAANSERPRYNRAASSSNSRYQSPGATPPPRANEGYSAPGASKPQGRAKPLPESPGPETPDKDGFSRQRPPQPSFASTDSPSQYYHPPPGTSLNPALRIPDPAGVNRLASTSSVSTTKAARGSPPPPETPVTEPVPGGIEARYAAAGIAGPSTLTSLQAQNLAAQQARQQAEHSFSPPPQPQPGASTIGEQASTGAARPSQDTGLEHDMQNLHAGDEPPPAYSTVSGLTQGYPADKRQPGHQGAGLRLSTNAPAAAPPSNAGSDAQRDHPAYASNATQAQPILHQPQPSTAPSQASSVQAASQQTPSPLPSHGSPPPLPEGWIAHPDPNSGQYYYIHLPTQATQWEFPKGPTPLNFDGQPSSPTGTIASNTFASPTASTFAGKPLASPGIPHRESMMTTMSSMSSPTAAGFQVPPPAAGVEMYRVAPTNGVYFGPYLRYTNMDVENGYWYGSILLVTDSPHPPTIHLHQSTDLSPNREWKLNMPN